jgi:hypothetical protein
MGATTSTIISQVDTKLAGNIKYLFFGADHFFCW